MADENKNLDVMNANDPLDINELAALNEDFSEDFIEQLQNQITQNANLGNASASTDVTTLFEEVANENTAEEKPKPQFDSNIDDNFIKKYKAKIEKQNRQQSEDDNQGSKSAENKASAEKATKMPDAIKNLPDVEPIETLSKGNIVETPVTNEQLEYNESLDLLDDNIKYSKYVIYIDPENTEFIESLTVKERKNLINKVLKEQDNITLTNKRLDMMQNWLRHAIVAVLTIAIATPIIYHVINASLEATINNHRRSHAIFKTLYKEKGKLRSSY